MSALKGRHFEGEIVLWPMRCNCLYGVSYGDLEQMMAERGVAADHTTIYRWYRPMPPSWRSRYAGTGGDRGHSVGGWTRRA